LCATDADTTASPALFFSRRTLSRAGIPDGDRLGMTQTTQREQPFLIDQATKTLEIALRGDGRLD
jgi:hypothetical protein